MTTYSITSIMGGMGRVVMGGDWTPAYVGALGPVHVQTRLHMVTAFLPSPTISRRAESRSREVQRGRSYVQSHNLNL